MAHSIPWGVNTFNTKEQLNAISFWKRSSIAAMSSISDASFAAASAEGSILCEVDGVGIYRWQSGSSLTANGSSVVNGTAGQWLLECPSFRNSDISAGEWRPADIAALKAITGQAVGQFAEVPDRGEFLCKSGANTLDDGEFIVNATSGLFHWVLIKPDSNACFAYFGG